MASLLVQVKAKMAIYAHERARGLLEGEYGSVFKGRSMDFDDLREYIPGDDVKDIDWRATARSGMTLIRRYIAVRKHNILLVVDTGRNMAATTAGGRSKRDVAVMLAGVIGSIALKHGDFVGMVAGNIEKTNYFPLKSDRTHLEQLLQALNTRITDDAPKSRIASQLDFVARTLRQKMIVVVISDEVRYDDELRHVLRLVRAQHELLWLVVSDADLTRSDHAFDIESQISIPNYLRNNAQVVKAYHISEQQHRQSFASDLNRLAIASEIVDSEEDAVHKVLMLLERHKSARRR